MKCKFQELPPLGEIERSDAVHLNATVPDAPTWEQIQKAWYAVGADVAGLDWSAFVSKVSAAQAPQQKGASNG